MRACDIFIVWLMKVLQQRSTFVWCSSTALSTTIPTTRQRPSSSTTLASFSIPLLVPFSSYRESQQNLVDRSSLNELFSG